MQKFHFFLSFFLQYTLTLPTENVYYMVEGIKCRDICYLNYFKSVADPGFPVGGRGSRMGALTPEVVTFRKFCMSK